MKRLARLLRQPGCHMLLFCLFLVLSGWPFMAVPGKGGVAGLFLYLLVIWGILNALLFLVNMSLRSNSSSVTGDRKGGEGDV
jgi:hypothetical protein